MQRRVRLILRISVDEENAHLSDFTDQPHTTTDVVVHSSTVHARGDVGHIEAVVALAWRRDDW